MNKEIRHFGLFVYLGIELRNFIFSGLSNKLNEFAKVSILSHQHCLTLDTVVKENNIDLIDIPYEGVLNKRRRKLENYFLSSRRARIRLKGGEVFSFLHDPIKTRLKDYFIGNTLVYKLLQWASACDNNRYYFDEKVAEKIKINGITDIIIQGYFTPQNMTVAITAKRLGCNVWVINWSWKDFYINEYIPFQPDGFFTWSEQLKFLYQNYNRHISGSKILSIGNLSFDKMFNYVPEKPLSHYTSKYNFNADSEIILYTMVNPLFFPDEQLIACKISQALNCIKADYVLLMKPNPMDTSWDRFKEVEVKGRLITVENLWHYDEKADFNMITEEGQREWLDLIYYSKANISVASTVTIEYLIMQKPVINILFDDKEELQKEFVRLYEAPFYRICGERKDVFGCRNIKDVTDTLLNLKSIKCSRSSINELIEGEGMSLEIFIKAIKNCERE